MIPGISYITFSAEGDWDTNIHVFTEVDLVKVNILLTDENGDEKIYSSIDLSIIEATMLSKALLHMVEEIKREKEGRQS